ncbi:hypothetical protein [Burkholderia anthina]|uniref:DUF2158 domain-containing protein n=1 Tax=Burkholderia anthina TaxID=179879 RepID=A0A6P2GDP4_9BURK|nr:hypothetical protein [Burkholderia anthina]MBM2769888.1 hypothetical protein [Burkholderia anthina]VVU51863.1 hypothetical protein BAN20980_04586 [Burkholderia anthina]
MAHFKYAIGSHVTITASSESGEVVGRAEYAASENSYLVRYRSADGRAMECWWSESALA